MYRLWLIAALLAVTAPARTSAITAGEMLQKCRVLAASQIDDDNEHIKVDSSFETGACWGAFLTIQGLSTFVIEGGSSRALLVCAPAGSRTLDFIWAFLEYMRKNPKEASLDFERVALRALWANWKCKELK